MIFSFVGAGAVGGYYGALLARAGHRVSFVARGAHLEAIRAGGIRVLSAAVGDFTATVAAESDPTRLGHPDVAILAVKTYDNATALPLLRQLAGPQTTVLTIQNGVDSADEVAAAVGEARTLAGATYIATAIDAPGVIRQTGAHRRIVFGEMFHPAETPTARVLAIHEVFKSADIHSEVVADARTALWEKFTYLAPFAAVTGASRLPIGPIWADADARQVFVEAIAEVGAVARASGVALPVDVVAKIQAYTSGIPATTRSSLLIDLSLGKRIEVESLAGSVVRRGAAVGVPTPIMRALYAVLKPYALGPVTGGVPE
jgi:2-dehydropantoate 2-reductase